MSGSPCTAHEAGDPVRYSVHELAKLSGVSVRTLHHYDAIGLLCPKRAENNYRVYEACEVDRLQQILLYREVGLGLADIKALLDDQAFDVERALEDHLARLVEQRERTDALIASVEKTLASKKGTITMNDTEKFEGFKKKLVEENERTYGKEARAADLHRQWLTAFWKDGQYSAETHKGITEMYVADERFKRYYEAIAPGAAEFLRDAVAAYCS
ncbi:MerR family transcriptional regulator [Raoultibacter phocaeensis]|uniref:MerR family transcriptional regulator n=1 Tax=Raoultibacter phocaeensis TaxID=2479841 RepID=UPI00111A73A9|nr:MerR family transcriptional regulator [Raoultibacter phocaeensis]